MYWILDRIAGIRSPGGEFGPEDLSELVESQRVRINQSRLALRTVSAVALVFIVALWNQVDRLQLTLYFGSIILAAILRVVYCAYVERSLQAATYRALYNNELGLYATSLISTTIVGSGYWWLGMSAPEQVVLIITMLSCIYAVGTVVNSSMQSRNIPEMVVTNLGQGVVFFTLVKQPPNYELALALAALMITLIVMSRQINRLFVQSIHIRDENREKNAQLERQKQVIEEALHEAERANTDKNRFMAAASHDLRQPLHAMSLFLGSLRLSVTDPQAVRLLDKIEEATNILNDQFNSLLDLSKFDAGVVETDPIRIGLEKLVGQIISNARPMAEEKNLALEIGGINVVLYTDPLLFERLLQNLVVNAIKFTDIGTVAVESLLNEDGSLEIRVEDTGPGIAPEDLDRIFMDYYQVHNKARSQGKGSGLGLSIAKRIADLLDLQLAVESRLGKGSCFIVTIPRAQVLLVLEDQLGDRAEGTRVGNRTPMLPGANAILGKRFLLVDDDPSILDALSDLLHRHGAQCFLATCYEDVQSINDDNMQYDMAILDDMLSDSVTGLDIATQLLTRLDRKRILITTGNTSVARLAEIHERGFEVLTKPIAHEALLLSLSGGLDGQGAIEQAESSDRREGLAKP